jgi:hypothetical protein
VEGPAAVRPRLVSGKRAASLKKARTPRDPVAAWEELLADGVLFREELDPKHVPLAVAAFRAKYGDDLFLEILRDVWTADWIYGEGVVALERERPQDQENAWFVRPWLGAKATGRLVFSSPTFWEDWRVLTRELAEARRDNPKKAKTLLAAARGFLTAVLSHGFSPDLGRPTNEELRQVIRDARRIAAETDPARDAILIQELQLQPAEEARIQGEHFRIATFVSITRHRPRLRGNFEKLELAEKSVLSLIQADSETKLTT